MRHFQRWRWPASWVAVDWAVAAYTLWVAVLVLVRWRWVPHWPLLVLAHGALVGMLIWLPPRGAPWEQVSDTDPGWLRAARRTGRFLRYTYPALLLTFFFEEVRFTVHALGPEHAYWFEPYLYAADRAVFGATPAAVFPQRPVPLVDEAMHALYFSYYPMVIAGVVMAWQGPRRGAAPPRPGFHTAMTSMMLGFFSAYVWYPFLPARGPWESADLMSGLREFEGFLFTPLVGWMIDGVAVSGGCFPSAHIAGPSGLIVGLAAVHRRRAVWFGLLLAGLGVACVYTRYHHAMDIVAGMIVGIVGGAIGCLLTRTRQGCRA